MNADLVVALVGVLAGIVAFVPAIVGEKVVEGFGSRLTETAERMRRTVPGATESIVAVILFFVVLLVVIVGQAAGDHPGLTPWSSHKQIEESFNLTLTILKWTGIVAGGLVGLAIAVTLIGLALWLFAQLLSVVPVGPRSLACTALVLTVSVSAAGYVVAHGDARRRCDRRTAASLRGRSASFVANRR